MKRYFLSCLFFILSQDLVFADGHYPDGAEGLKGASLPPPGTYLKWYNMFYTSDTTRDQNGNIINPAQNLQSFATVPRFVWISKQKFLGADYGINSAIPLLEVNLKTGDINQTKFSLGDILIEQMLAWHTKSWDIVTATGLWLPAGNFDPNASVNIGKGFWTGMYTFGATYYFDQKKTWHLSSLSRYQNNSRKSGIDIRPGSDFLVEWGLGRTINQNWNVGVTAYTHWQVTNDTGSAINYDANVHTRYYAMGPEVNYFYQPAQTIFALRYQKEFAAVNHTEGQNITFSFVVIF